MSETIDISKFEDRETIVNTLLADIDEWSENVYNDGFRRHLGASVIGKSCARELWYSFRWCRPENYGEGSSRSAGQVLRLFQRGHREEIIATEYLEGIGCVFDATKDNQLKISDVEGHFGGSLDNVGLLPARYGITEKVLFEFKTYAMADFNRLKKEGLKIHKPQHWSQICVYGYKMNLRYCVYLAVDKNTDEIYIELVELDQEHAKIMIDKAAMIITAKDPPPKISMSSTNFACKWCTFKEICHNREAPVKNCRSCAHAVPAQNKQWLCGANGNAAIPEEFIPLGCSQWLAIET